ncbi:MAG: HEAT repeat domain-containing protein [Planctomycetaceae bacterium]
MNRWLIPAVLAASLAPFSLASAQGTTSFDAKWIWHNAGDPGVDAPAGKVWFRRVVRADEPSTGAIRILCDDHFVLWVNGRRIGEGTAEKVHRFNLNGIVERGMNIIAVEAENKSGKAGLFVDGEVRGQGGGSIPFDSGAEWKSTTAAPKGEEWIRDPKFAPEDWKAVKVIAPHTESPWKALAVKESYLDRYEVAPGFEIVRIAEPELAGTLICMTWGNRGRLIVARERGPIVNLIDTNNDGTYDKAVEYSKEVQNCQGLCMVFDDLYAAGDGPGGRGSALYRLPDANHDDVADKVELLYTYKGNIGDHGPHAIVHGPDGWLYNDLGNHAWITQKPEPNSLISEKHYEGNLLEPAFEDARGHAVGIKAPGGTIWRFSPDGKKWWNETAGFRNQYDFAFNNQGEMFSFDSDMEWDVGLPWYKPVRVNHCIPGADFGWRSGAKNWPEFYFDSLPTTVDIGRGSPTGVVFYNHSQFPEKYRDAFIICDWSMGRIMAVPMKQKGATYVGEYSTLVSGNPLNVSDIDVDRDGTLVFCTGGRGTEGGVYRVKATAGEIRPAKVEKFEDILTLPQNLAPWATEMVSQMKEKTGAEWEAKLTKIVRNGKPAEKLRALSILAQFGPKPSTELLVAATNDQDADVRAFATHLLGDHSGKAVQDAVVRLVSDSHPFVQRRATEAAIRSGSAIPVEKLLPLLASEDRWLRFAGRLALERIPSEQWHELIVGSKDPDVALIGLLALYRNDAAKTAPEALKVSRELLEGGRGKLSLEQKMDAIRMTQLALLGGGKGADADAIGRLLFNEFPTGNGDLDAEAARVISIVQIPGAVEKFVRMMETADTESRQIHYALVLRYLKTGWTPELKTRLLTWYESTQAWEGGHSLQPYLANIVGATLEVFTPEERKHYLENWSKNPFTAGLIIRNSLPEQVTDFEKIVGGILEGAGGPQKGRDELIAVATDSFSKSTAPGIRTLLRNLYEAHPDRRESLARAMAAKPTAEDWPVLVRTLGFADSTTVQLCLGALQKLDRKPEKADEYRSVILSGLKLNDRGGAAAVQLLKKWSDSEKPDAKDVADSLAFYKEWYGKKFPDAPPAELPALDPKKSKYAFDQLVAYLEQDAKGREGNVELGRKAFEKAKCVKCHRFEKAGETIGPDLTSVRRRFQRKEIIESLVFPSQVISDQYRMLQVITVDGLVHVGMPITGNPNDDKLTLLLSDATKISVPKSSIEESSPSKVSVMPTGLLDELSLEEIADLFAFLETSKNNAVTPAGNASAAGAAATPGGN